MVCGEQQVEGIGISDETDVPQKSRAGGDLHAQQQTASSRAPAGAAANAEEKLEECGLEKTRASAKEWGQRQAAASMAAGRTAAIGKARLQKAASVGSVPVACASESSSCCRRQDNKPACAALVYSGWLAGVSALAPTNYPELSIRLGAACLPTSLGAVAGDQRQLGCLHSRLCPVRWS